MKKHSLTSILITVSLFFACTVSIDRGEPALINPRQTNDVKVRIKSVTEMKKLVLAEVMTYLDEDRIIFQDPNTQFLKNTQWGPIVFVENISEPLYPYYVFHGQLPDGSIVAQMAMDAVSGEFTYGGWDPYYSPPRKFLLRPDEALGYLQLKGIITNTTDYRYKAVYYPDGFTLCYYPDMHWKYEIYRTDGKPIHTKNVDFNALYFDPYVISESSTPNATNGAQRFTGSRIYGLEANKELKGLKDSKGDVYQTFIPIRE